MSGPTFSDETGLQATVALQGTWDPLVQFTVSGLPVSRINSLYYVGAYVGEKNIPQDIRRLRRSVDQVMRRMGQPVIVKHMYNDLDAKNGLCIPSPSGISAYGGQVRNKDPYSYGTGYCSAQLSPNEWISPAGEIVTATSQPAAGYIQAPMYRGYGPGFLTYLIEPDAPVDLFKLADSGALIKTTSQKAITSWYPALYDNDLIINVTLDEDGYVAATNERYQAKLSSPVTIRGLDRRGRRVGPRDYGNRHLVNQVFDATLVPEGMNSVLYQVETDR